LYNVNKTVRKQSHY